MTNEEPMRKSARNILVGLAVVAVLAAAVCLLRPLATGRIDPEEILAALQEATQPGRLTIEYPLDETLFPPEIAAASFLWKDDDPQSDTWLVTMEFQDGRGRINSLSQQPRWTPKASVWEDVKKRSLKKQATVTIVGINRKAPSKVLSLGRVTISTSSDRVGAPLFYREVNLPFVEAVKDPSHIRWRFGSISSVKPPPIVLERLPVCGNCHSFSADGAVLGMDVDYANDKGSYVIAGVKKNMTLDKSSIITWSDYQRSEDEVTYGLLSQVSPDGRYVVSTVKDESVFVPKPGLDFSQLFFPVKGILCIHDRQTGGFESLPGADNPSLVQSNPAWSPDGKYIVFAATEAYELKNVSGMRKLLLSVDECREFLEEGKPFKFSLYRIPFNEGKGGQAEPIKGASLNGMSNFFPKYSPDGKWIVFCRAENYMLLQPDSELYIIPAEGGQERKLRANTTRMNSWHSFSPNGRWLVFSGKPESPYTRLYLTHIDEQGMSTPPVALEHMTAPDRAANIPEFVNVNSDAIRRMHERFIDDFSYVRAAREFLKSNDYEGVERQCRKALELNPKNADAYYYLGLAMFGFARHDEAVRYLSEAAKMDPDNGQIQTHLGVAYNGKGMYDEAVKHLQRALEIDPNNGEACFNLGVVMFRRGDRKEAIRYWSRTVQLKPNDYEAHYNLAVVLSDEGDLGKAIESYRRTIQLNPDHSQAYARLGLALCIQGAFNEAIPILSRAVELDPENVQTRHNLVITLARLGRHNEAIGHWRELLRVQPDNAAALAGLGVSYAKTGQFDKALPILEQALSIAASASNEDLVAQISRQISLCKDKKR